MRAADPPTLRCEQRAESTTGLTVPHTGRACATTTRTWHKNLVGIVDVSAAPVEAAAPPITARRPASECVAGALIERLTAPTSDSSHDIVLLGRLDNGVGIYRFAYNGSGRAYVGVMAQEVQALVPEAVVRGRDGYLRVYYDKVGVKFQTYDQWIASGARVQAVITH